MLTAKYSNRQDTRATQILPLFGVNWFRFACFGLLVASILPGTPEIVAADSVPDATELLQSAIQRARRMAEATNAPVYLYDKRTTIDTLDSKGRVTQQKVKLFEVTMTGGVPRERLIGLEGKRLSARALAQEAEKSDRWRRKFEKPEGNSNRRSFVPADMAAKFDFRYLKVDRIRDRQTHVIAFTPKSPAPAAKGFGDRIVNQLAGRLWIDVADSQITRLDVKLGEKVNLWGGLLGALNKFGFQLDRRRSDEGVWYNHLCDISLDARGLLKRLRMNIKERSSNFRESPK